MNHYATRYIFERLEPAHSIEELSYVSCDLCGLDLKRNLTSSQVDVVYIDAERGRRDSADVTMRRLAIDICGPCFRTILLPHIKEHLLADRPLRVERDEYGQGYEDGETSDDS